MTVIRVDPPVLESHASRIEAEAESLRAIGREASRATHSAPSYDGQFGPKVDAIGAEAWSRMSAQADRLEDLAQRLRAKAGEFAAADQLSVAMPPGPWLDWDSFPWWLELAISMFPGGDLIDILRQLGVFVEGEDVDELVLILAIVGLIADLGWIEPSPASEVPNAGLAALKLVFKAIPAGPVRKQVVEILSRVLRDDTARRRLVEIGEQIARHPELIDVLRRNPNAVPVLLRHGPEAVETLARYGDDGAALVGQYGDDMLEFLRRTPDEAGDLARRASEALQAAERLEDVGLHSDEAAGLLESISGAFTHGSGDRVVLGEWIEGGGGYVGEAVTHGGIYYETPEALYNALGRSPELAWQANEQFLRSQLAAGVPRIEFVGDVRRTLEEAGRTFRAREISFLMDHADEYGYELVGNVWIKLP